MTNLCLNECLTVITTISKYLHQIIIYWSFYFIFANCNAFNLFTSDKWNFSELVIASIWLIYILLSKMLCFKEQKCPLWLIIRFLCCANVIHQTPRIPYSCCCSSSSSSVTKSVKWRYLGNQAWYHRSAVRCQNDRKKFWIRKFKI